MKTFPGVSGPSWGRPSGRRWWPSEYPRPSKRASRLPQIWHLLSWSCLRFLTSAVVLMILDSLILYLPGRGLPASNPCMSGRRSVSRNHPSWGNLPLNGSSTGLIKRHRKAIPVRSAFPDPMMSSVDPFPMDSNQLICVLVS